MTPTDQAMTSPSPQYRPRSHCPTLEIHNLPHVVLRELLPMLNASSKLTLRLVSQNLRDLIDTQKNFRFNVTLSDETSTVVLRFNHFDIDYFPRVLHCFRVTTLRSPLKIFSTSISRCPLPTQIQVLKFKKTRGISQHNFLKLVNFYGKIHYMKKIKLNMMAVEKVEEVKAMRKGLKMNYLEELELTFPPILDQDIRFPRLLLGGVFPSLHTLYVNLQGFGKYYPILYQDFFIFVSRNLTSLKVVDVLHPFRYCDPELLSRLKKKTRCSFRGGVLRLANSFDLRPRTRQKFKKQIDASRLESLSMNFPWSDVVREPMAILGMTFLQAQKYLVDLELYNFPVSEEWPVLAKLIRNSASTLVTIKLVQMGRPNLVEWKVIATGENNDNDIHFNLRCLELCSLLKTFILTCDIWDNLDLTHFEIAFPDSLENLALPRMDIQQLQGFRAGLPKLKTIAFQRREFVSLEISQMLLGDEGFPSLEKVTVFSDQWDWQRIRDWVTGHGMQKPVRDVTISNFTEVDRFWGSRVEKVVLSRTPLN